MSEGQDNKDDETHKQRAIAPVAPKVFLQEEGQVEVSASPAFQCLDELFQQGKLTGTKVAQLKARYTELHRRLASTRESESKCLQKAKEASAVLEQQNAELEKADNFPESSNTEVTKMRVQLLKHTNELNQSEERKYQFEFQKESLQEEKRMLEREYSRLPKKDEIDKQTKELTKGIEDLRVEIAQRKLEAKNLREELETKNRQVMIEKKEMEKTVEQVEKLKDDLVQVHSLPGQLVKEMDKMNKHKNELDRNRSDVDDQYMELTVQLQKLVELYHKLSDEKFDMDREKEQQQQVLADRRRQFDNLMKDFEYMKEKEAVCLGDRATLDLSLRHIHMEKKNQHDIYARKQREKDRDLRNFRKTELHLKVASEAQVHTQTIYDKVKSQADSGPKDDGSLMEKRKDLQKEVDEIKRKLAAQNSLTAVEQVKVEQSIAEEERLLYEQSDLRIEVVELTRLGAIKGDEREQKARDFMRAELRYHRALDDLKAKDLAIIDNRKKHLEMMIRLKDFAKMYDVIKNERNKCVNLIQASTQKAAEMREKIKILQNEIEILRTACNAKERQFQKAKLKHVNAVVIRDQLRNDLAKHQRIEEEMREKREQQRMDIAKLNLMINQAEEQMVKLRKRYENAVQHRNDRGVQLIERNEEVCIFYEKVNIQDDMIRKGDVELQSREEEIRFLKMQVTEENRSIGLARKTLPNKKALESELVTLQIQLSQCQDRMSELEKQLENPYDESRVRLLEGKDLTPAELNNKIEELEIRLAEKEEQLLEKDLIFDQVCKLAERVNQKMDSGKVHTLNLAKEVNDLQAKIKAVTRKMMAQVSELSMTQAEALKYQQEVRDKESTLEQAYIRMERGEAPTNEAAKDWERMVNDENRRIEDRQYRQAVQEEEEQYILAGGATTTAEPRPNAYIPDDDTELPVPRPYGANAPFKPQQSGANMRHIRKPIIKPIEI
ncbi:coiled-coil domain-containing protein 146-like [Anneissia japonica]|uniref:coiled-coil domain-containing protein 146-like n=1 Tax=Anneissia japonica TaxID=1529436 RepID=UPI0014259ADB|nr:coiled-coil domain-containing protein 146-like [Anneissia japonica]XP_033110098.1 coiled-coil domain-containing protein 146-like [Anneissia japonica]XP_033110099.1 coiled-coil domain-containing protein 146-like [Anneissia japonica]